MNDTRLLLEEQTSRNALLEKKQRKFDSELALVTHFYLYFFNASVPDSRYLFCLQAKM